MRILFPFRAEKTSVAGDIADVEASVRGKRMVVMSARFLDVRGATTAKKDVVFPVTEYVNI